MSAPVPHATWPCLPPAPDQTPTVLRLPGAGPRAQARAATRRAAQATLAAWGLAPVTWRETATGPCPETGAATQVYRVSFSYAGLEAWIAFHRGPVGLDACLIRDFPGRLEVARTYLPESPSPETVEEFARRWARQEARLKISGLALTEGCDPPAASHERTWTAAGVVLALAWE